MTGLHYRIREKTSTRPEFRVFNVRRSDEKAEQSRDVFFELATKTAHCGGCSNRQVTMRRTCPHAHAVRRMLGLYK